MTTPRVTGRARRWAAALAAVAVLLLAVAAARAGGDHFLYYRDDVDGLPVVYRLDTRTGTWTATTPGVTGWRPARR